MNELRRRAFSDTNVIKKVIIENSLGRESNRNEIFG